MRLRSASSFAFSILSVLAFFVACSSSDLHPAPGADPDGGGLGSFEASIRDDATDGADDGALALCSSKMKDGRETDIDCGGTGNGCARCALGKTCAIPEDCALGAECRNNLCALCKNTVTDGDESDSDCGGKACPGCTVGKRCNAGSDCASGSCINNACACPKDMTIISLANGGAYCIDSSEVTKGQYFQFITANVPVSMQDNTECKATNTTFVPRGAWPPATTPTSLDFNMGLPVHYVDWCDAVAYCNWAKKELCGAVHIGTPLVKPGTPVAPAMSNSPSTDAWFNACSAQGTKTYPYGAIPFDAERCNDDSAFAVTTGPETAANDRRQGFGNGENQDDGVYRVATSDTSGNITAPDHIKCQGGSVGVFQMSGNVAEWEYSCDPAGSVGSCLVRGGSYADTAGSQTCDFTRAVPRMPPMPTGSAPDPLKDIGFRCCQY